MLSNDGVRCVNILAIATEAEELFEGKESMDEPDSVYDAIVKSRYSGFIHKEKVMSQTHHILTANHHTPSNRHFTSQLFRLT